MNVSTIIKRLHVRTISVGNLFYYHIKPSRCDYVLRKIFDMIEGMINDSKLLEALYPTDILDQYDALVDLNIIFSQDILQKKIKKKIERSKKLQLKLMDQVLKEIIKTNYHKEYEEMLEKLYQQMILEMKRIVLKEMASESSDLLWIKIDTFDIRYLYQLDKRILGFIVNEDDITERNLEIAKAMNVYVVARKDVPVIEHKLYQKAPYHMKDLKVYLKIADVRHLETIDESWYAGIFFQSEYKMITKGIMMSKREVYRTYKKLFAIAKDKPIQIGIPNFRSELLLELDSTIRTEVNEFSITHIVFDNWIAGISQAIYEHQPNITFVIPNVNSNLDLHFWEDEMNALFMSIGQNFNVGITIETEAALQYSEDFELLHSTMYSLDALIEEYSDGPKQTDILHYEMKFLIDDLKTSHFIYRVKQPKQHLMTGDVLNDPYVLRKFINFGFREFVLPVNILSNVSDVFDEWEKTRGMFSKKTAKPTSKPNI